jgi:hypothetical protein
VEDEDGQRHPRQLVAGDGQHARQEQRPELRMPEDITPARTFDHPTRHTYDPNHILCCDTSRL